MRPDGTLQLVNLRYIEKPGTNIIDGLAQIHTVILILSYEDITDSLPHFYTLEHIPPGILQIKYYLFWKILELVQKFQTNIQAPNSNYMAILGK